MELTEVLRTTGAVREFTDEPVGDELLREILDSARFAPIGGNRQGWRAIVVQDPARRRALRELYLTGWYDYLALSKAGLVAWAPITDREAEERVLRNVQPSHGGEFAENLDKVPALIVVLGDLRALAAMDRDAERYSFAGGASVYPFVWSILLAARDAGLGGVMTTMLIRQEDKVKELLGVPEEYAVAAAVVLGHPVKRPTRLKRAEVDDFTTVDDFAGPPLGRP